MSKEEISELLKDAHLSISLVVARETGSTENSKWNINSSFDSRRTIFAVSKTVDVTWKLTLHLQIPLTNETERWQ